ncbi:hypothetical protein [Shimia sp. FJ5]|uniref:hypothetical protein n=1 Tax=Shimia sp. FJ5 TaxID=3079054 RepID=UPI00293DA874|nr:hypothetical protein [Shimia sp. FJ5]MDV4145833.1 hypothetical protein [Shimia sp. FJ5]
MQEKQETAMNIQRFMVCVGMSAVAFFFTGLRVYVRKIPENDFDEVVVRGRVIGISSEDAEDVATAYAATRRGCALIAYHKLPEARKQDVKEEAAAFREKSAWAKWFGLSDAEIAVSLALSDLPERSRDMKKLGRSKLVEGGLISSAAFLFIMPLHIAISTLDFIKATVAPCDR